MENINLNELREVAGGNFWGDVVYLLGRLYYGDCDSSPSGGINYDHFNELRGPKL